MALRALIEQEGGAILHGYPWGVFSHWDGPWSILAGLSSRFVYLHHATGLARGGPLGRPRRGAVLAAVVRVAEALGMSLLRFVPVSAGLA